MTLLPKNSTSFERSLELVTQSDMSSPIRYLWNPEKCPSNLLHVMALTFQVDQWDEAWSHDAKIHTLQDAFNVHRIRGTPASIKRVLKNAGYGDARLEEDPASSETWYQYHVYMAKPITIRQAAQVLAMLEDAAPLHCQLVGLHFDEVSFLYDSTIDFDGEYAFGSAGSEMKRSVLYGKS